MSAPRAVLDTNVFVSALLGKGPPARLYEAFKEGSFWLVCSKESLAEVAEVLLRPELGIPSREIKLLFRFLQQRAAIVRPTFSINACRDPKDDFILACAVSGRAEWVVTGDNDLLVLNPFRGIHIVTPTVFLNHLSSK